MRRPAIVLLPLLAIAACKSKARGDSVPPTLVAAVFVGTGATPVAGDTLLLYFDESIALVSGALVSDADVSLAAGTSLGTVTSAPALLDSRTLSVVLGPGVNLTPGVSTLALAPGNDAVTDAAGNRGRDGAAVVVTKGDGDAPAITKFTASDVDALLNGQGTAGGTLQVPSNGFTLDLAYADATSTIVATLNQITASVAVSAGGQSLPAGANLVPHLVATAATSALASYTVPASVVFPTGDFTLAAVVRDSTGMQSLLTSFALRATPSTDDVRPFETSANPSQVWFLETARDLESYTLTPSGGSTFRVSVAAGSNGRADLHDALLLTGMLGADAGINTSVVNRLQSVILDELARFFSGANVTFTFTAPGTFPAATSVAYGSHGFSQICIAGAPTQAGVLGLALYDPNNTSQNNDCLIDFQGTRLGVFVLTVLDNPNGFGGPSNTLFRQTYDPLRSELTPPGTPIGGDADDAARLAGTRTDGRATVINNAILRMGRFIAVVVAHETGHSMGLVKNGAMPVGLYGGDAVNFAGSNSEHIRMPATLFPSGSVNIMSPALNFELAQSTLTTFNSLNLAYLRERVLYNR